MSWTAETNIKGPVGPAGPAGGLGEAPTDGQTYGRNNAAWSVVVSGGGGTASSITFTPAGNIAATNVQAAIAEVDTEKVAKAGDTMTGNLTVNKSNPSLVLQKTAAGQANQLAGYNGVNARWSAALGDSTAEGGSNAGSNFALYRYSDAGSLLDTPLTITRSSGVVDFKTTPTINGVPIPSGDVVGPAGAVADRIAVFNGATGKLIKDGGQTIAALPGATAVRYDIAQGLTTAQQAQARNNTGTPNANSIINGDFRINQGGYVSAAVLAAAAYGHDQWKAGASGGDYSFTQLASSTQITIAAGKSLIQPIEDVRVVGGSYVLTWTGTAQARAGVNTLTPSGAYAASPLLISGQTAGTVMSVEFNTGTLGTVKLESGAVATPFVMPEYASELTLCMRYYWRDATPGGWCYAEGFSTGVSGNLVVVSVTFRPILRAAPTVTLPSFTIGGVNAPAVGATGGGPSASGCTITALSNTASGNRMYFYASGGAFTANARL